MNILFHLTSIYISILTTFKSIYISILTTFKFDQHIDTAIPKVTFLF